MKKGKSRNKRKKTRSRLRWIAIAVIGIAAVISVVCVAGMLATKENAWRTPEELLVEYMDHIPKQEYEEMYAMLHIEASGNVSQEDFVTRNSAIYEGIEVQNIAVQIIAYDVVECIISGVPAGIGDPVFEKLNANLAKAVMSIGAVKGFEIGDGFDVAKATGKNNNDAFRIGADGSVSKETNHAGGILGGMSDGSDIILRATIKPTPSISATQHTVNKSGEEIDINIKGRHDPIIVPRAVVVVESMAAVTIVDAMFANMSARMDSLERFYK